MDHFKLKDMLGGWFVGDFSPSVIQSKECEVAIKQYNKGDTEDCHHHRIAKEITVVLSGVVEMFGRRFTQGDIVLAHPFEATEFIAIEDTVTVVVKLPSAKNDKYSGNPDD